MFTRTRDDTMRTSVKPVIISIVHFFVPTWYVNIISLDPVGLAYQSITMGARYVITGRPNRPLQTSIV